MHSTQLRMWLLMGQQIQPNVNAVGFCIVMTTATARTPELLHEQKRQHSRACSPCWLLHNMLQLSCPALLPLARLLHSNPAIICCPAALLLCFAAGRHL
jgi:hypothetical protein